MTSIEAAAVEGMEGDLIDLRQLQRTLSSLSI